MPTDSVSQSSASAARSPLAANGDFIRLHITPLDPDLLKLVVPATALSSARNISYHAIETFPEKRYGFVELPRMEAEKLKKKLHGSVLKGSKMRVEKARPEEVMEPTGGEDNAEKKKGKKSKDTSESSRKRKRDPDVVEGVVLKDRKVKRGWTEPTENRNKKSKRDKDSKDQEKKKRAKSKYTEQDECLLKTKVPPNATSNLPEGDASKRKKKKGKAREVTVHEFEKMTKFPSFLKNSTSQTDTKPAREFVEGKGWIDEEGAVVEAVKQPAAAAPAKKKKKPAKPEPVVEEDSDDGTSSSGTSSDEDSDDNEDEVVTVTTKPERQTSAAQGDDDSSEEDDNSRSSGRTPPLSAAGADVSRPISSSSSKSLTIKIPPPITPSATKVHPLEALYKRKAPGDITTETPAKGAEPFSFFETEGDEDGEPREQVVAVPMTPFTRQDLEFRNIRSAAPTPDTAHPTRMKNFWADNEKDEAAEEDDDADEDEEADDKQAPAQDQQGATDFQSWFWDNRRDLNRSWMRRRKTAAKEKRHRENKARASKAV